MCNSNSFSGQTAEKRATHTQEWFQSTQSQTETHGWVQRGEDCPASVPLLPDVLFLTSPKQRHQNG